MSDKKRICVHCDGKGLIPTTMWDHEACKECGGTGAMDVKEKRKSILVPASLHKRLRDLAYEFSRNNMPDFMNLVADTFDKKLEEELENERKK